MNAQRETEFNQALGQRLSLLRQARRMSQEYVGAAIGVRAQQIHKYETGENKITPERLSACAALFGVPIGYFYGEEGDITNKRYDRMVMNVAAEICILPPDIRKGMYDFCRILNKNYENAQDECGQKSA